MILVVGFLLPPPPAFSHHKNDAAGTTVACGYPLTNSKIVGTVSALIYNHDTDGTGSEPSLYIDGETAGSTMAPKLPYTPRVMVPGCLESGSDCFGSGLNSNFSRVD